MPLDPSIALQAQAPNPDIIGNFTRAQASQTQNQLAQQQISASQTQQQAQQFQLGQQKLSALQDAAVNLTPENWNTQKNLLENFGIVPKGTMPDEYSEDFKNGAINHLAQQSRQFAVMKSQADIEKENAETKKTLNEANQISMFNPDGDNASPSGMTNMPPPAVQTPQGGQAQPAGQGAPQQPNSSTPIAPAQPNKQSDMSGVPLVTVPGVTPPGVGGQRDENFLTRLHASNPSGAAQIRGMSNGDLPIPSDRTLATPYGQGLMNALMRYDPSASAITFPQRKDTRISFTSGADANNVTAINTAIAHLGRLESNFGTLDNSNKPIFNKASQAIGNAIGDERLQAATAATRMDILASSHELAAAFRKSGMSESEIEDWQKSIKEDASPAQMHSSIHEGLMLLDGRVDALTDKYNRGMGTSLQGGQLLSPAAQIIYNNLKGSAPAKESAQVSSESAPPGSANAKLVQQATGGVVEGSTVINPKTGHRMTLRGGQWQ